MKATASYTVWMTICNDKAKILLSRKKSSLLHNMATKTHETVEQEWDVLKVVLFPFIKEFLWSMFSNETAAVKIYVDMLKHCLFQSLLKIQMTSYTVYTKRPSNWHWQMRQFVNDTLHQHWIDHMRTLDSTHLSSKFVTLTCMDAINTSLSLLCMTSNTESQWHTIRRNR